MALDALGNIYSVGFVQSDAPGQTSFGSSTAASVQAIDAFSGQDGFLAKARYS